jgi:ribosomal protein L24
MFQRNQWRIFPDDLVQVVTGSETGATGRVLAVIKDKKQPEVIVEGVNMVGAA